MPDEKKTPSEHMGGADAHVLAHEVRGALTVISGFSELLRRDLSAEDRTAALDGILRAVRRIDRLVDSVVSGATPARTPGQRISLVHLAESVAAEQRAITGRQVTVTALVQPEISGVPDALERALGNLIDNALKYSLRNSGADVEVGVEDGMGVIAVGDRGPGIPAEERERALEPFERLGRTDVPGTGLGLAVVSGIAEAHGGRLEILEREGGGAVVRMLLPLAP